MAENTAVCGTWNQLFLTLHILALTNPALDNVGFPDELKEGRVINETCLALLGGALKGVQFITKFLTTLLDVVGVVVTFRNKLITLFGDLSAAIDVDLK